MTIATPTGSLLIAVAALAGCATTYRPRPSPRIQFAMERGAVTLVRDGRSHGSGLFGYNIVDLVRDNPTATAHARAYRSQSIGGFTLFLGGTALIAGGVTTLLMLDRQLDSPAGFGLSIGLLLAGLVADGFGLGLALSSQTHFWDAVNVYNDSPDVARR